MQHDEPPGPITWSLSRIVVALQNELLGPLYSILNNTNVLAGDTTPAEHRRLVGANLQSVTTLERSLTRIVELANLSTDSLVLRPANTSIHSMTLEAALSASSDTRRSSEVSTDLHGPDAIISTDHNRTVSMIANALHSLASPDRIRSLSCKTSYDEDSTHISVLWTVKYIQPAVDVSTLSPNIYPNTRRAVSSSYLHAIAVALGANVDETEDRTVVRLSAEFPTVHSIDTAKSSESETILDDARILHYAPSSSDRFELPIDTVYLDQDDDLADCIATSSASLLVLNHSSETDDEHLATNLYLSQKSTIPVLLRSSDLTYDQFVRYRDHVDVILLEPAELSVLTRYIAGLSGNDRRHHRRRASLH